MLVTAGRAVPEPGEEVGGAGDQVEGVHGVSDDLGDGPGEQQQREANGSLRRREEVEDEPGDVDPGVGENINTRWWPHDTMVLTDLDQTCWTVTWTLDLTRPSMACRISSKAAVWKIWRVRLVLSYRLETLLPAARWQQVW